MVFLLKKRRVLQEQPPEMFCKKRCSSKFRRPATLLKKKLWHRCFPVNFAKFLRRTPFLQNTSGRLLLLLFDFEIVKL